MSIEQNKALSRRYIEVMHNTKNPAVADEVFATDCVVHLAGDVVRREGYKQHVSRGTSRSTPVMPRAETGSTDRR